MNWTTIKNPRKENGDLGDLHCTLCKKVSGAYIVLDIDMFVGRCCLEKAIEAINKEILSGLPHFYKDSK